LACASYKRVSNEENTMQAQHTGSPIEGSSRVHPAITGSNQKTLEAIFRHPLAHNLEWNDVVALVEKIGAVDRKANNEFAFEVAGQRHLFRKPHAKDLTGPELIEVRKFLMRSGWSSGVQPWSAPDGSAIASSIMVVVDHHGAKLYLISRTPDDGSAYEIKPYDPHHFLHHLTHKDQSREQGQRAPEDSSFYERIAQALSADGRIVVVGHGTGKSNAAHNLTDYLRSHHPETYRRIVRELVADLSSCTPPQLLEFAQQALR
jgi:hypothetical protein